VDGIRAIPYMEARFEQPTANDGRYFLKKLMTYTEIGCQMPV